jgi:2-polyprenyl-3-methyl-5-hydroxy-6-metoxy-1,4-benzoquinol methylase
MKNVINRYRNNEERVLFSRIDESVESLHKKLLAVDLARCGLSEYNQRYLNEYLSNFTFFARFYTQVLIAGLRGLAKPVSEAVFVDYGGGSGFFSLLAKEAGFKTVVYNDIYDVSVEDARILSRETGLPIDQFVCGDARELFETIRQSGLQVDLICSFEVIEHIYDLQKWLTEISTIGGQFTMVCSSSANIKNPYIRLKLAKAQRKAEFEGSNRQWGSKQRDTVLPFVEVRKQIIREKFTNLTDRQISTYSRQTRGFNREDIIDAVSRHLNSGEKIKVLAHPTNTCDPNTGNWAENLIDHKWLKKVATQTGFSKPRILPGLYTWSDNKAVRFIKKILNVFIRLLGNSGVWLSPIYIFRAKKN